MQCEKISYSPLQEKKKKKKKKKKKTNETPLWLKISFSCRINLECRIYLLWIFTRLTFYLILLFKESAASDLLYTVCSGLSVQIHWISMVILSNRIPSKSFWIRPCFCYRIGRTEAIPSAQKVTKCTRALGALAFEMVCPWLRKRFWTLYTKEKKKFNSTTSYSGQG